MLIYIIIVIAILIAIGVFFLLKSKKQNDVKVETKVKSMKINNDYYVYILENVSDKLKDIFKNFYNFNVENNKKYAIVIRKVDMANREMLDLTQNQLMNLINVVDLEKWLNWKISGGQDFPPVIPLYDLESVFLPANIPEEMQENLYTNLTRDPYKQSLINDQRGNIFNLLNL